MAVRWSPSSAGETAFIHPPVISFVLILSCATSATPRVVPHLLCSDEARLTQPTVALFIRASNQQGKQPSFNLWSSLLSSFSSVLRLLLVEQCLTSFVVMEHDWPNQHWLSTSGPLTNRGSNAQSSSATSATRRVEPHLLCGDGAWLTQFGPHILPCHAMSCDANKHKDEDRNAHILDPNSSSRL